MTFEEGVDHFRALEQIEDVLLLISNDHESVRYCRLVVAWSKTEVQRRKTSQAAPTDNHGLWTWLWKQCRYDEESIKGLIGSRTPVTAELEVFRKNHLIYPDGTVSLFATKALRQIIKSKLKI